MSRKSKISLSNRALFYQSRKDTLQQHEESHNSNVVKRDETGLSLARSANKTGGPKGLPPLNKTEGFVRAGFVRARSSSKGGQAASNQALESNDTNLDLAASLSKAEQSGPLLSEAKSGRSTFGRTSFDLVSHKSLERSSSYTRSVFKLGFAKTQNLEKVSSAQPKSDQHNYLRGLFDLCNGSLGFTFSPFAFIFGTTFLFTALASTLQKQDGNQWLRTLSHNKLPGLTENKVSQMSSWVFLESVLSQYISRDNSLLVSTTSLPQDAPDSAQLSKAVSPRLEHSSSKAVLEIQLSPLWNQHIKKDFLGVFPLREAIESVTPKKRREVETPLREVKQTPKEPECSSLGSILYKIDGFVKPTQSTHALTKPSVLLALRASENSVQVRPLEEATSKLHDKDKNGLRLALSAKPGRGGLTEVRISDSADQNVKMCKSVLPQTQIKLPFSDQVHEKTLIWPWYQITAYHPPSRVILPTWTGLRLALSAKPGRGGPNKTKPDSAQLSKTSFVQAAALGNQPSENQPSENQPSEGQPSDSLAQPNQGQGNFAGSSYSRNTSDDNENSNLSRNDIQTQDRPYSAALSIARRQGLAKSARSAEEEQLQCKQSAQVEATMPNWDYSLPFHASAERLRLEDDSIPSKKDSVYSKIKINEDTLADRVLNIVKKSFYDYGLSIPEDLDKLVDSKDESLSAKPFESEARVSGYSENSSKSVTTNSDREQVLGSERVIGLSGTAAVTKPKPRHNHLGWFRPFLVGAEALNTSNSNSSYTQVGVRDDQVRNSEAQVRAAHILPTDSIRSADASQPLFSGSARNRPLSKPSDQTAVGQVRQTEPNFAHPKSKATLRVANRALLSEPRSHRQSTPARTKPSVLLAGEQNCGFVRAPFSPGGYTKPTVLSKYGQKRNLIFGKSATPKKSFWEYAHSISGYHFPELQDHEVAELFGKVAASNRSKVGLVALLSETQSDKAGKFTVTADSAQLSKANRRLCFAKQNQPITTYGAALDPAQLSKVGSGRFCVDTNQVFLAPYLAEVPLIMTASTPLLSADRRPGAEHRQPFYFYKGSPPDLAFSNRPTENLGQSPLRGDSRPTVGNCPKVGSPKVGYRALALRASDENKTEGPKGKGLPVLSEAEQPDCSAKLSTGAGFVRAIDQARLSPKAIDGSLSQAQSGHPSETVLSSGPTVGAEQARTKPAPCSAEELKLRANKTEGFVQSWSNRGDSPLGPPVLYAARSEAGYGVASKLGLPSTFMGSNLNVAAPEQNSSLGFKQNKPITTYVDAFGQSPEQNLRFCYRGDSRPSNFAGSGRFCYARLGNKARPLEEDFKIRYTPLELEQENKVKKAFKELGRDYLDYLKQPKDSLPALLLSPSLEEDKQIEEEEVQRLAQEKAAAKTAAKRAQNEEDSISDSETSEEEFNTIDPLEVALSDGQGDESNLEEEPLNDEEIEDSRFERLRFTREVEEKKEEEDCRGVALSLTGPDSKRPLVANRPPFGQSREARVRLGQSPEQNLPPCSASLSNPGGQPFRAFGFVCYRHSREARVRDSRPSNFGQVNGLKFAFPSIAFGDSRLHPRVGDVGGERKHSFFGQRSFWPTRLFAQEERLVSAHVVNPYIRYDQSNPWLIPEQGGALPVTDETKWVAKPAPEQNLRFVHRTTNLRLVTDSVRGQALLSEAKSGRSVSGTRSGYAADPAITKPKPVLLDLQNLKNLQTQARLGLVRFVYFPTVDAAKPFFFKSEDFLRVTGTDQSRALFSFSEAKSGRSVTRRAGNQNRIYKPDPRLRLTPLESPISEYWRDDRRVEASPFRVTSKERPHIVLPQLSESEWQKSIEWQLKSHFLDEDTRLEPLVATEPYKTFKVKRIERSLPWLTLEKPSFKLFQWPGHDQTLNLNRIQGRLILRTGALGYCQRRLPRRRLPKVTQAGIARTKPSVLLAGRLTGNQNKSVTKANRAITTRLSPRRLPNGGYGRLSFRHAQLTEDLNRWSTIDRPVLTRTKGMSASFLEEGSPTLAPSRLVDYSRIPLGSSFATYSKDRSALSVDSSQLVDVTKRIFSSQDDLSTELIFEPVSTSSWFLIYRLFLALTLKEVFKYIYRISLKDFFIRIINSEFGRTITSPEFRQSVQFEPFPEFYKPKNRLKDIVGIKNALLPLSEIIWFLRNNCRSRSGPNKTSGFVSGVVLLGPDGVDTTAIAQAVAGEAKVPIIVQSLRALTLTHSHPQKRLEKVLLLARAQSPCVLFLDELDVIGQSREGVIRNTIGDGNSLISLDSSQLADGRPQPLQNRRFCIAPQPQLPDDQDTSQGRRVDLMLRLLTVMDGLHHLNGVVIITTSKNSATLDPALLRPGRFDRLIHLTLPNPENRMELFKAKTRELGHTHKMPWEYLSLRTADMGGADIVSAINYSVLRAIVNDTVHTVETLEYGLNCVKALNNKRGKTQQLIFPT